MSLLGLIGVAVVKKVAKSVALSAAVVASDKIDENIEKKKESIVKGFGEDQGSKHLMIQINFNDRLIDKRKDKYTVFDENKEKKYSVKSELVSAKHRLHIYDAKGKEVGAIKQALVSLRMPIGPRESNPVDFAIEIGGKKLGNVASTWAMRKIVYEVDFNGWHIEGKRLKYDVFDKNDKVVAHIETKIGFESYIVLDFQNPKDELLVLMLAIILNAALVSK